MAETPDAGRPLRFLVVGGVNTLFGLAFYPALQWACPPLVRHYMVALAIAQAVSLLFAFALHKAFVFRTRGKLVSEFLTFCSFYLAIYAINWIALPLLVEVAGLVPWIAQTGFVIATVIGSWFFHSRLTFRRAANTM